MLYLTGHTCAPPLRDRRCGARPRELGLPPGFPSSSMSPAFYLLGQRWGCPEAKHLLHQALDPVLSSCGAPPTHRHWSQPEDRGCKREAWVWVCGGGGRVISALILGTVSSPPILVDSDPVTLGPPRALGWGELISGSRALGAQKHTEMKIPVCHSRGQAQFQPL